MTPDELSRLMTLLGFGANDMANILGVRSLTVRRWLRGKSHIPDNLHAWLQQLADSPNTAPHQPKDWDANRK